MEEDKVVQEFDVKLINIGSEA